MKNILFLMIVLSLGINVGCSKLITMVDENLKKTAENTHTQTPIQTPTQNTQIQPDQNQPNTNNNNSYNNTNSHNTLNNSNNTYNNTNNYYYNQPQQIQPIEQPQAYITPMVIVTMILNDNLNGYDAIVSWTNVKARSYTVYRTYTSPLYKQGWQEIATLSGFSMRFADAGQQGVHYYKVVANFNSDVQKVSIPVSIANEPWK